MNDRNLVRQIDSVTNEVNIIFDVLVEKIEELENNLVELEKQHEKELIVSYDKGYNDAVSDHTKLLMK